MYYITYLYDTTYADNNAQLTFEDLFNADGTLKSTAPVVEFPTTRHTQTKTFKVQRLAPKQQELIETKCRAFEHLFGARLQQYAHRNMQEYYDTFSIPKHSGGFRTINAPKPELKALQKEITIFLEGAGIHAHAAAYAYVKNRTAKDAVIRHQKTGNTCYLKLDFHDFFGSCNASTIRRSLCHIPFFAMLNSTVLENLLHVAMLNGGLPQGTPLSPWLTNQIMVPYDYTISNCCNPRNITYTRYADDMLFSAPNKTALQAAIQIVKNSIRASNLQLNDAKTKISTIYGKNWNLGLMTNKDNEITVGWRNKERARATIHNFMESPNEVNPQQASEILGKLQYYRQIEPEYFDALMNKYSSAYNRNVKQTLIDRIKGIQI